MGPVPTPLLEITAYDGRRESQCEGDQKKSKKVAGHSTWKGSPEESLKGPSGMRAGSGELAGMVDTGSSSRGQCYHPQAQRGKGTTLLEPGEAGDTRERPPAPSCGFR